MARCVLQNSKPLSAFHSLSRSHKDQVRLTNERDWYVEKRSIPRYNEEYLANTPLASPDVLDFAIEKDEPVVYLMIEQPY